MGGWWWGGHHNELLMCFRLAASPSTAQTEKCRAHNAPYHEVQAVAHNAAHNCVVHCGVGGACAVVKVHWWGVWLRTVEVDNRHNGRCPSTHLLAREVTGTGSGFKNCFVWFSHKEYFKCLRREVHNIVRELTND